MSDIVEEVVDLHYAKDPNVGEDHIIKIILIRILKMKTELGCRRVLKIKEDTIYA